MADKKEKTDKKDKKQFSESLSSFLEKNKKVIWVLLIVVLLAFVGFAVYSVVSSKSAEKTLALVDQISYELTNGSSALSDSELKARRAAAKEALEPLLGKGGVGGVRANMLAAELAYQEKNYNDAIDYWKSAADKGSKSYTAPLAYFNIASSYEEIGNADEAAEYYKRAALTEDFLLKTHALFSYGRVLESSGKYDDAAEAYTKLNDEAPDDTWAKLAKTRLIDLKVKGKIK